MVKKPHNSLHCNPRVRDSNTPGNGKFVSVMTASRLSDTSGSVVSHT